MNKVKKYNENIYNFITTKSCFFNVVDKALVEEFINNDMSLFPIAFLAIFNAQIKKNKSKSYNVLHTASLIFLMTMIVAINERRVYYETTYGEKHIKNLINQATIFIFEAISQNTKTMDNTLDAEVSAKIQKKLTTYLREKLLVLTETSAIVNKKQKMKKTDIIKYKFSNKDIIDNQYQKLSRVDKNEMIEYINTKYGIIGQCSFLFGWIMGVGDLSAKTIDAVSDMGTLFGTLIKLTHDFANLELHISTSNGISYNYAVNCGIHETFQLFYTYKPQFIEKCMVHDVYSNTMKEIIDHLEGTIDDQLKNTELELESQYSSFTSKSLDKKKK